MFGSDFRFLGDDLHQFSRSDRASRERQSDGTIRFAVFPFLGDQFIIYSGSMAQSLARYRLDPDQARASLMSPFNGIRFEHPETRWFNVNSSIGAACYFSKNAPQILDFFARLVSRNIAAGRRTLLVVRKKFASFCRREMERRLREMGHLTARVVMNKWSRHDLSDPLVVSLITYGTVGLNRFEHIECAYCLGGYYVPSSVVENVLNDIEPAKDHHRVTITTEARPARRRVRLELPRPGESIVARIAPDVLVQKEADVVVQGVGRVRPFTKPREVITFQLGELPGVEFTREFCNLAAARAHFELPAPKQGEIHSKTEEAVRLKVLGCNNNEIAEALDIHRSTVKRYLRKAGVQNA